MGERPQQTLTFICRLRDSLSEGAPLRWHGDLRPPLSVDLVCHLPPPDGDGALAAEWRARFQPGLCYFRRGPGFIQIRDTRDPTAAAGFVLDEADVVDVFTRCLRPARWNDFSGPERELIDALVGEKLLLALGDSVLTLPHRMKRWPVPAAEI